MILVTLSIVLATTYHDLKHYEQQVNQQLNQLTKTQGSKIKSQQKQIQNLQTQLQSKAASKPVVAAAAQTPTTPTIASQAATVVATTYSQPTDWYKAFIYQKESGNNPTRWNSTGCFGLGQNCPAVKGQTPPVLLACSTMDYGCEDAWFTHYMQTHIDLDTDLPYGTWQNAYTFWIAHSYW